MKKIGFFCIGLVFSISMGTLAAYGACSAILSNQYVECYLESRTPNDTDDRGPTPAFMCNYDCYCSTGNPEECEAGMAELGLE